MNELERIEMCLRECKKLIHDIEQELTASRPIGKTYEAFIEIRKKQLIKLEIIYNQLGEMKKQIII